MWKRNTPCSSAPYIRTFKLWTSKAVNVCSRAQSLSSFTCLARSPACAPSVYFTAQCCIQRAALAHSPPSLLPPLGSNTSCLLTQASPCRPAALLYFSRYCTVRLFALFFVFVLLMYYLCKKNYKLIAVECYIADCVSWVPRLTLLDLWTNWTYKHAFRTELICM